MTNSDLQSAAGVHTDRPYVGGGSARVLTIWIPLGIVPPEQGAMVVLKGSHNLKSLTHLRERYVLQSCAEIAGCRIYVSSLRSRHFFGSRLD